MCYITFLACNLSSTYICYYIIIIMDGYNIVLFVFGNIFVFFSKKHIIKCIYYVFRFYFSKLFSCTLLFYIKFSNFLLTSD